MKLLRIIALVAVGASLSACATTDTVSRNAPLSSLSQSASERVAVPGTELPAVAAPVRIGAIVVDVPRTLSVSEANSYLPKADIVWRGEAVGDRHAQVQAIFEEAMQEGAQTLKGSRSVDLLVTVKRFHGVTEKTRRSVGGVHNIVFDLALADSETGEIVVPWHEVRADLKAYGGAQAQEAERLGQTQRVRILDHLAYVLRQEVTQPGGHRNAKLGLIQKLNQI